MDQDQLADRLGSAFDGHPAACTVVARQARDLADSGWIEDDLGSELTIDRVVQHLSDAPAEYDLVERWNWWIGSLDVSHGGYRRFRVRPDVVT